MHRESERQSATHAHCGDERSGGDDIHRHATTGLLSATSRRIHGSARRWWGWTTATTTTAVRSCSRAVSPGTAATKLWRCQSTWRCVWQRSGDDAADKRRPVRTTTRCRSGDGLLNTVQHPRQLRLCIYILSTRPRTAHQLNYSWLCSWIDDVMRSQRSMNEIHAALTSSIWQ